MGWADARLSVAVRGSGRAGFRLMHSNGSKQRPELLASLVRGLESMFAPEERLVYVNRDLDFSHIKVVGFDLDYTLARYRQEALEELTLQCVKDKLRQAGFPQDFAPDPGDSAFAMRGLVVDRLLGNILKLDRHGYVGRGYHARQPLAGSELKRIYREQRIGVEQARFSPVDTLFSLPEVNLFTAAVDHFDLDPGAWSAGGFESFAGIWDEIRQATDASHRDGSIKDRVRQDPGSFVNADPELSAMLHRLRSLGKKVFLLTNSEYAHTETLLRFLLHESGRGYAGWQSYFDWIVVSAGKPGFFTEDAPFRPVGPGWKKGSRATRKPRTGKVYRGGNQHDFQQALNVHPDQVLFVGDHIYEDIVKSKKNFGWRTALVVEEIEDDITIRRDWTISIEEVESLRRLRKTLSRQIGRTKFALSAMDRSRGSDGLDLDGHRFQPDELDAAKSFLLGELARKRKYLAQLDRLVRSKAVEVSAAFNPYWGSLFWEAHDISRFAQQAESFACAYTSRASNLLFVTPEETLFAGAGRLAHASNAP